MNRDAHDTIDTGRARTRTIFKNLATFLCESSSHSQTRQTDPAPPSLTEPPFPLDAALRVPTQPVRALPRPALRVPAAPVSAIHLAVPGDQRPHPRLPQLAGSGDHEPRPVRGRAQAAPFQAPADQTAAAWLPTQDVKKCHNQVVFVCISYNLLNPFFSPATKQIPNHHYSPAI